MKSLSLCRTVVGITLRVCSIGPSSRNWNAYNDYQKSLIRGFLNLLECKMAVI